MGGLSTLAGARSRKRQNMNAILIEKQTGPRANAALAVRFTPPPLWETLICAISGPLAKELETRLWLWFMLESTAARLVGVAGTTLHATGLLLADNRQTGLLLYSTHCK
jgi:hypothetical protein